MPEDERPLDFENPASPEDVVLEGKEVKATTLGMRRPAKVKENRGDKVLVELTRDDKVTSVPDEREVPKDEIVERRKAEFEQSLSGDPFDSEVTDKEILMEIDGIGSKKADKILDQTGSLQGFLNQASYGGINGLSDERAREIRNKNFLRDFNMGSSRGFDSSKDLKRKQGVRGFKEKRAKALAEKGTRGFESDFDTDKVTVVESIRAEETHEERKRNAKQLDESLAAPTTSSFKKWKRNPAKLDFPGVDTKTDRTTAIKEEKSVSEEKIFKTFKGGVSDLLKDRDRDTKDRANALVPDEDFNLF